jgi:ABC-2 type transport system permease protein
MTATDASPAPTPATASAPELIAGGGFWRRTIAMLIKEFIQLKRDRVSFGMIIMIPLMQLLLFGYAINTNPRHLPTAVLLQEQSDLGRSILKALENTKYFEVTHIVRDEAEFDRLLASGTVLFAIEIPANFERAARRPPGAAGCRRRHRSGGCGIGRGGTERGRANCAPARPFGSG